MLAFINALICGQVNNDGSAGSCSFSDSDSLVYVIAINIAIASSIYSVGAIF
jgi:hypothetical protein